MNRDIANAYAEDLQRRIAAIRARREANPFHPVNVLRRVTAEAIANGATPIVETRND